MKTILILGGYGFLGTNIIKYIDAHFSDAYRCIVFDKLASHPAGLTFDCVHKSYAGDFSNKALLERIFAENHIDWVIHSLSTTVPVDSANARFDVESNLLPTLDILSMMVAHNLKRIVYLSSGGAIYGTERTHQHAESDDVFPVSSYGVVKLAIEKYMMQYAELYGLQPLILRLSNPYGPYHYSMKQGVINVMLTKALRGEKLEVWGDGNGKKDYIYVEDFVRVLFALIEQGVCNEVINIGSGKLLSVNDIVAAIQQLHPSASPVHLDAQRFDVAHFELNLNKLHHLLPMEYTPFEVGLQKTLQWTLQLCD